MQQPRMAQRKRTKLVKTVSEAQGAARADMPGFVRPQLGTLKKSPPTGERWIHEIKLDGYRTQAHLRGDNVRMFTRNGLDWTKKLPAIAESLVEASLGQAILDGEVVVVVDGRPDFAALQADLAAGRQDRLLFYVFDLIHAEGYDLRRSPQLERKRILKALFDDTGLSPPVLYNEHLETDGAEMLEAARRMRLEGIISKKADAAYRSERTDSWQKIKCLIRGQFPIVGFDPEKGGIAALYLARREGSALRFAGKVGTGFTRAVSADLRRRLDAITTTQPDFARKPREPRAVWVEPKLTANVDYSDVTKDGYLRHASFKGLSVKS